MLSSRPEPSAVAPAGAEARFRVVFSEEARADDIASLRADEGLSVLRGPDPWGAYILGATAPQRALDPADVLRRLRAHRALVRASSLASP